MLLREQSISGCITQYVFQFSVVQVLVELCKQFINNFVFPTLACAAGFTIILIIIIPPPVMGGTTGWYPVFLLLL